MVAYETHLLTANVENMCALPCFSSIPCVHYSGDPGGNIRIPISFILLYLRIQAPVKTNKTHMQLYLQYWPCVYDLVFLHLTGFHLSKRRMASSPLGNYWIGYAWLVSIFHKRHTKAYYQRGLTLKFCTMKWCFSSLVWTWARPNKLDTMGP